MSTRHPRALALAVALPLLATSAHAEEVYFGAGFPGVMIGYAHPLNEQFTLRADYATLGSRHADGNHDGIDYTGHLKLGREGVFGDWFFLGGLRLTGGVTFNQHRLDLDFQGNGGTVTIGDASVVATSSDTLNARAKYPSTTPYLGLGYGHQQSEAGLGFVFDLGASFGKPKVDTTISQSLLAKVGQSNYDQQVAKLDDDAGKVKVFPQLTIGLNYRF
jgi:hypothetical protein